MPTELTIAPTLGRPFLAAQGQPGGYDAIDFREWASPLQKGVMGGSGAFLVTQNSAAVGMSVDVACNIGKTAIAGNSIANQGMYIVRAHPTKATLDIATAHATLPRIDSVYCRVEDTAHDASGLTRARVLVLTGAATSGATLANRTGAPAAPANSCLLADILVPAADTTITNDQIRDRRSWAMGALAHQIAASSSGAFTTAAYVNSNLISLRVETNGNPVLISTKGAAIGGSAGAEGMVGVHMDGVEQSRLQSIYMPRATADYHFSDSMLITPAAGSHLFDVRGYLITGTSFSLRGVAGSDALTVIVEELLRPSTNNGTI